MSKILPQLKILVLTVFISSFYVSIAQTNNKNNSIQSIDIGLTINLVRTISSDSGTSIIGSSYEGTLINVDYKGNILWKNTLSGFMNHDVWCQDITGDGNDEVLAANANGKLYCLNSKGKILWEFSKNEAPLKSVCVIHKNKTPYVVLGGYDKNIYYLNAKGELVTSIISNTYSIEKPWGKNGKPLPESKNHISNFIRPLKKKDGTEYLVVHGIQNSMSGAGSLYVFNPLENTPFKTIKIKSKGVIGELRTCDANNDGNEELLLGRTGEANKGSGFFKLDVISEEQKEFNIADLYKKIDRFGYRVTQPELIRGNGELKYFTLFGSRILLSPLDMNTNNTEVLACKYSFNDMWQDAVNSKIILASSQSGGSAIHIINLNNPKWKQAYQRLAPPGKIASILKNTATIKNSLEKFQKPNWQKASEKVFFMTESRKDNFTQSKIESLSSSYKNPIFLNGFHVKNQEKWDRSKIKNEKYRNKKDRRKKYVLTQKQSVDYLSSHYEGHPGIAYWGGHGNDPYMFQLETTKKVIDKAEGKKTVLIYPELEDHTEDFGYVMNDLFYPLAKHAQGKNANIFVRTKHLFWQANAYLPVWNRLISGEFADVFVPAMEETTDKSMELSLASRMGIWTSGATNSWGARCARDNTSFDRTRQFSHQMLPNHFLRTMVYSIASGAQYINNFAVDQPYMSLLWDAIAKGALYVPKRSEILSFSPVHLSINKVDDDYLNEASNVKWLTFYNKEKEKNNPLVFSHLNGTWPGAPLHKWDFSSYAANATERRLNFIPSYENGLVLITPPQKGIFADTKASRKPLAENLHPIYKEILKEYITDGKTYYSADGKEQFGAKEYYSVIEKDIKKASKQLPLTVTGNVGWVLAQVSPTHLRLTLVDGGYINPKDRIANIKFNTISPLKVTDILNEEQFEVSPNKTTEINIPLGAFRFIDIELKKQL